MRSVLIATLLFAAAPLSFAGSLTIVLQFQGPHSDRSVEEMKRELEGIMKESKLTLDWRSREEAMRAAFENLVVVRFKGKCVLEPVPYLMDERGPLAYTYSTDGAIQPFGEIACDRVANAIRPAMSGGDFAKADLLMGRALGRVVAHELVHMLSKSGAHGREGVARTSLSGASLIAPDLRLSPADLERIYTQP